MFDNTCVSRSESIIDAENPVAYDILKLIITTSLPVACPWSMVLSWYSGFFHH
jgi:hypothetical protein